MTQDDIFTEGVYALIMGERHYQERLGPDRTDGHVHSVGDELVLLKVYIDRALDEWTDNAGDEAALDVVRKIAGIAVRCMDNHGAPSR